MNFTQSLRFVLAVILVPLVACCNASSFNFEKEFNQANDTYYGPDETSAKNALTTFIERGERHEPDARKVKSLDYDRVLAMAWLQLASIHEANREQANAEQAIEKAIRYFDRVDQIASDDKYKKDKRQSLREFLTQAESYQTPEWKKKRSTK